MTDKEKQIEEIARIIHFDYWGACDADSCSDCPHSDFNICNDEIIAEKLYDKLFPEGSVVLSKEVFEDYMRDARQVEEGTEVCYNCHNEYAEKIDQARKETAEKFYDKVMSYIGSNQEFWIVDEEHITIIGVDKLFDFVVELAKQFGVEVEE